jgi:endonuclease YncB( thermonuclease family)
MMPKERCGSFFRATLRMQSGEMRSTTVSRWWTVRVVPALAILVSLASADSVVAGGCNFEPLGESRLDGIVDSRTIKLADGREIYLSGIETAATRTLQNLAVAALTQLATGHTVTLQGNSEAPDRYGRQQAFVSLKDADTTVQAALLAQGAAVASGTVTDPACAAELGAAESSARIGRRGVWAEPNVIKNAESPGDILARIGRFALVEGKVRSVRQAGATIYINFGPRWTRDFAVTIPKRTAPLFERTGAPLKSLENRRIRVRGWIERRGGPRIEASRPGQIEIIGD